MKTKKAFDLKYQHLGIKKDGSKITHPREVVDDYNVIIVLNAEKKKLWQNLWYMPQNTTQSYPRHIKTVIITVERRWKT